LDGLPANREARKFSIIAAATLLVDRDTGFPVAGFKYDLSAEGVIDFCSAET
jgi:hypothetical protein